jgi:hypothetical protein
MVQFVYDKWRCILTPYINSPKLNTTETSEKPCSVLVTATGLPTHKSRVLQEVDYYYYYYYHHHHHYYYYHYYHYTFFFFFCLHVQRF